MTTNGVSVGAIACFAMIAIVADSGASPASEFGGVASRPITELMPAATIHLGKTADWVVITDDAVWVGTSEPNAVQQIDPRTNTKVATVRLPGIPCAGLAVGFGSLWVPLCAQPNTLARVDLRTHAVNMVPEVGPAESEGGITTSTDSVWLVIDHQATLARIDPSTGKVRQRIQLPPGSYNPHYSDDRIWVTRAEGDELTAIDAGTGAISSTVHVGQNPRFLTSGAGAVWTLNQGDGSLTRVDTQTGQVTNTIALATPGHGGDISFGAGMVWTTVAKVPLSVTDAQTNSLLCQWSGPGGDSLGVGHGAIWLTDYNAGTVSRIGVKETLTLCTSRPSQISSNKELPEIGTRMPDGTVYSGLSIVTGQPEFVRAAGGRMADGSVYAGLSPDSNRPMYTTAHDAPATMPWGRAMRYCQRLSANGHHDWRVPSLTELAVLFGNRADIGGFNETGFFHNQLGYYWSSFEVTTATAWGQRFNDGYHDDFSKDRPSLLRCVRSASSG